MTTLLQPAEDLDFSPRPRALWRTLLRKPGFVIPAIVLLGLFVVSIFPGWAAGFFGHADPRACDLLNSAAGPSAGHPFGRDVQGCDVYANVIYGTRTSISIGFLTTTLATLTAAIAGTIAGSIPGVVDAFVSRIMDICLGFPFLLGAIVLLSTVRQRNVASVSVILALFAWPMMARLVRSSVRSVRALDYVAAGRLIGISTWRLSTRYVLANSIAPLVVVATTTVGAIIVAESSLTYLGVGLQPPTISWGLQLAAAQSSFQQHPHLLIYPATFLAVTVLCIITLGDSLRAALDPKQEHA
ncbi:ABC transporter permease [Dactylosporangium fulvum]|uniref:ABC transporter permease n=1 Tax=Dactylosporangium fulvum TaxID=53359 RepID=A0ABY5WA61_9ACTN|nr:ABC transporter permease [Dactylosporangium fulvum]UWP86442.1 ABC transporter permease [Dactylosporangium fulvum]